MAQPLEASGAYLSVLPCVRRHVLGTVEGLHGGIAILS